MHFQHFNCPLYFSSDWADLLIAMFHLQKGATKLHNQATEVNSLVGYTKQERLELKEQMQKSYEEQLKRITEVVCFIFIELFCYYQKMNSSAIYLLLCVLLPNADVAANYAADFQYQQGNELVAIFYQFVQNHKILQLYKVLLRKFLIGTTFLLEKHDVRYQIWPKAPQKQA